MVGTCKPWLSQHQREGCMYMWISSRRCPLPLLFPCMFPCNHYEVFLLLRLRYSTSDPQKIFLRHGTLWHSSFGCHKCSNQGNWGYRCCCGSRWTHSWLIWKKRILKRRKNQLWSLLAHLSKNVWQIQYGAYAMFICDLKVQRKWWKGKGNSVGEWLQNQI